MKEYIGFVSNMYEVCIDETQPIVRCHDCKFCMAYMASTYCDYMAHSVEPNGFCAWGKRKRKTNEH